jgi:predicted alpha/beta superfamily hydrolase
MGWRFAFKGLQPAAVLMLVYHPDFASRFLPHPRPLVVWLPPGYDDEPDRRYTVLYLHDGQNLFDPDTAFGGVPWGCDVTADRLIRAGEVRPVILVGVGNTRDRMREYGPRRPGMHRKDDRSADYGRFLVEEVKPAIDGTYRTSAGPTATAVGGSSMGGLISLHLAKWYPGVFGMCMAMSPSLWWDGEYFLRDIGTKPGWLNTCRIWLDMGGREGHTRVMQRAGVLRARRLADAIQVVGVERAGRLKYVEVPEGEHNEWAWGARFGEALKWLFGP